MRARSASVVATKWIAALSLASCASLALAACSDATTNDGHGSVDGGSASGADSGGPTPPLSQPQHGVATFYAADGTGACSFDASPSDLDVAAMNAPEFAGSAVCGECVRVAGPKGEVTVRIVDLCPECVAGQLDLSQGAFAKIADVSAGRVPITWTVVACNVAGAVAYRFKEGSSQYWTAIQVRNHRLPIAKLEWKKNGAYAAIPRESYDYFVVSGGVGTGAITLRVTASDGQTLEDTLPSVQAGVVVPGASQFH